VVFTWGYFQLFLSNEANAPGPVVGWIDSDSGMALDVNVTNMLRLEVVVVLGRSMSANVVIP
jgi:hypothetical protein